MSYLVAVDASHASDLAFDRGALDLQTRQNTLSHPLTHLALALCKPEDTLFVLTVQQELGGAAMGAIGFYGEISFFLVF